MSASDQTQQGALLALLRSLIPHPPAPAAQPNLGEARYDHGFAQSGDSRWQQVLSGSYPTHNSSPAQYGIPSGYSYSKSGEYHATFQTRSGNSHSEPTENPLLAEKCDPKPAFETDPRTIIDWPTGLRFVTKLTTRDESVGDRICKMISNQQEHEKQWWSGRKALLEKQAVRVEGKRKLDEVLRAVGGHVTSDAVVVDEAAELKRYDLKVHKACSDMTRSMTEELMMLGVPFFGTKQSLLNDSLPGVPDDTQHADGKGTCDRSSKGQITRNELKTLQKRMIQHLEDMYKD